MNISKNIVCGKNIHQQKLLKIGKNYSGAKFFYTEPISLNKAHSTEWKAFDNKTLHLYNHSLKNKDFNTCRSRVNLERISPFFISTSYNAVNPIQDFKTTLTKSDN